MIRNMLTVFRREIAAYFNAPIAYIFMIVFVLLNGGLFMTQFFLISRADMRPFFGFLPFTLSVFLPALTMRLWAEEKRGNTLELLLTFPMAPQDLVVGKFLASFVFYIMSMATTLTIPVMLKFLGNPDWGAVSGAYIGAFLLGAFFLAIGIFISGLVRDQIIAFILTMMICFSLHLIGNELVASSIDGWVPGLGSLLRNFLGTARHYDSFQKGVVDNRDVFYFLVGTVIFLVLNGFWLEGRMRPRAKAIFTTATAICAGILLLSNWVLAGIPLGRFDLTEGKIYTIAPATKQILKNLKAPVTAKLYISPAEKMPTGMKTIEQDVIDKLDEIRIASKGNFQYKIFHMEAANVVEGAKQGEPNTFEQELSTKGVQPFQVQSVEADEVGVRLVYSAVSLAYKEKPEEIIPRVTPDNIDDLEYMVISKIFRMMLPETPKIALVAPYQEKATDPQLTALLSQLGAQAPEAFKEDNYDVVQMALEYEGYKVSRIKLTEKDPIPEGIKTLVILEPLDLNDRQRYEINRFLVNGGSVFLAVQNYEYKYSVAGRELELSGEPKRPNVNPLLQNWGFEVDEQILVDKQHDVINLSGGARLGPFEMSVPVKIPIQILIPKSGMNPDISITSRLSTLFYLWGSALKIDDAKITAQNLKLEKLLHTSKDSWPVPYKQGTITPDNLWPNAEGRTGPFPVAVMAQGRFKDAFEGKPAPPWPKEETPAASETEAKETTQTPETPAAITPSPGKIILTGAVTLFQKHLLRSGGHLNFFLNSIDALSLGDELIGIRSKQAIDRSIGRVSAGAKVFWRCFVTLLVPAAIALFGTFRLFLRRRTKQSYLKMVGAAA